MTTVAVIVTTFNAPGPLMLSLRSLLSQSRLPDEIVVADDGSSVETARLVRSMAVVSKIPIRHAWQEDRGFRVAASRNNGILTSLSDYLIFLDGDCFVGRRFVEDHLRLARRGGFIAGTRVNVGPARQRFIDRTGDLRISFFSWGTSKKFHAIRIPWFDRLARPCANLTTANCAVWREDVLRVNGFNEAFEGHGGEDAEFATRLRNAGVQGLKMRHGGMAYHLAHPENPRGDPERITRLIAEAVRTNMVRCPRGLAERQRHADYPPRLVSIGKRRQAA